jgi:hypothetical protein
MHTFAYGLWESGESEVSEAAVTADPASLACVPGSAANWPWLASAAEMAAEISGIWPFVRAPAALRSRGYPRVATRTPAGGTDSVRAARDFTDMTLQRWGVTDRREDIVMVVSELLTNALRYTLPCPGAVWPRWPVRLGLLQPGPWVLCAVSDPSGEVPELMQPSWCEMTGRGLQVVEALCDDWGCTAPGARGKVVWATFATSPRW